MKSDSVCVFYIMFNGFTFSRHRMVVHQGNVSYTLSGAVYLVREGKVVWRSFQLICHIKS